ncbi:MAG: hypothetical protein LBR70_05275 [Lactobacillaceae bacterium]|jgi:hypothetical protein|nr:hypothetical protein [Lactobacillaceae bacterium]
MKKKIDDIISKYYKKDQVKKLEIASNIVRIQLIGEDAKNIDEKMKKEMYNVGIEKVSIEHVKK